MQHTKGMAADGTAQAYEYQHCWHVHGPHSLQEELSVIAAELVLVAVMLFWQCLLAE